MNSQANQPHRIGALARDLAPFWGRERQSQMHFPQNSLSRAIENQQLVLDEQRFGDHRTKTARPQQVSERHNKVDHKGGQVRHDPGSVPTMATLAIPGFCADSRYELRIQGLQPNMIEVCRGFSQRPPQLPSNRHAQEILCPGTGRQRQPESGSAMQRRYDLC